MNEKLTKIDKIILSLMAIAILIAASIIWPKLNTHLRYYSSGFALSEELTEFYRVKERLPNNWDEFIEFKGTRPHCLTADELKSLFSLKWGYHIPKDMPEPEAKSGMLMICLNSHYSHIADRIHYNLKRCSEEIYSRKATMEPNQLPALNPTNKTKNFESPLQQP